LPQMCFSCHNWWCIWEIISKKYCSVRRQNMAPLFACNLCTYYWWIADIAISRMNNINIFLWFSHDPFSWNSIRENYDGIGTIMAIIVGYIIFDLENFICFYLFHNTHVRESLCHHDCDYILAWNIFWDPLSTYWILSWYSMFDRQILRIWMSS
jgi:hypothetical protein